MKALFGAHREASSLISTGRGISCGAFFFLLGVSAFGELVFRPATLVAVLLSVGVFALAISASCIAPRDKLFFRKTSLLFLLIFFVPLAWTTIQLLPTPVVGNPVWVSARAALNQSLFAHISIDLPATTLEIGRYLVAAIGFLLAAAIAVERDEAQWLLPALALIAGTFIIIVATALGQRTSVSSGLIVDGAALAVLLGFAECANVFERVQAGSRRPYVRTRLFLMFGMALVVVVLCAMTLDKRSGLSTLFITACGAATFLAINFVRRWGFGIASIGCVLLLMTLLAASLGNVRAPNLSPLVAFSLQSPSTIERTERIVSDAPPVGLGGGAFTSVEGLYRGIIEQRLEGAATFMAKEVAELGVVAVVIETLCLAIAFGLLIKSAIYRTRDWVYAGIGASSLVTLGMAGLLDVSPANVTLVLIEGAVLGLAAAQQVSRKSVG